MSGTNKYTSAFQFAPFVSVFYKKQKVQIERVEKFSYEESEESDDEFVLDIVESNSSTPDQPWYQPNAELEIIYGFLNTDDIKIRKVYIQDPQWSFTDTGVKGTIYASEKAVSLKQDTSRRVWKRTNLLDMLDKMSAKHGLVPEYDEFTAALNSNDTALIKRQFSPEQFEFILKARKAPTADEYLPKAQKLDIKQMQNTINAANQKWKEAEAVYGKHVTQDQVDKHFNLKKAADVLGKTLKQYKSIPQGNKSDMQVLQDLAKREPGGPYLLDTRDNKITLKRRNFAQKPIASYNYDDPDSGVIEFTPESKNRVKKGAADNVSFSGWDKTGKNFFAGDANVLNDPNVQSLAKWRAIYRSLSTKDPNAQFDRVFLGAQARLSGSTRNRGSASDGESTNVVLNLAHYKTITVGEAKDALGKILESYAKPLMDSKFGGPQDAYDAASNMRAAAELEKNPASLRVIFNPSLGVGKIITMLGASKKYSGNYYIIKCIHILSGNSYAYTELALVRNGSNIKESDNFLPAEKLKHNVNKSIGPKRPRPINNPTTSQNGRR